MPDPIKALKKRGMAAHAAFALGDIGPAAKESVAALEALARKGGKAGHEAKVALDRIRK